MRCSIMHKTTELFCLIDDFCQQFEPLLEQRMLDDSSGKQRRNRPGSMSLSEMATIVVLFHTCVDVSSRRSTAALPAAS